MLIPACLAQKVKLCCTTGTHEVRDSFTWGSCNVSEDNRAIVSSYLHAEQQS